MKLLLVEDEPGIARLLKRGLQDAGYTVDVATDGEEGLKQAREARYGLLILDVMLPRKDGWQVLQSLREEGSRVPVLMLTARDTVTDRVRGLDLGADDYLPKPFDFAELLARVRAVLRRDKLHRARVIRVADLVIDSAAHRVSRAGADIPLTHREYELLEALAASEGRVLTREAVQERIWMDDDSYSNTVDAYIKLLRKKIDAPFDTKLIHTVRGVGYTLRVPDTAEANTAGPDETP